VHVLRRFDDPRLQPLVQEAVAIGVKAGIDAQRLYESWNVSSSSRFAQGIPRQLERNFDNPSFTLALTAKDVGLEAAREMNVPRGSPRPRRRSASAAWRVASLQANVRHTAND
jgi:3-hydroxyisobutyrate dehydrogenase-like beta-hydroxyacid dehydrogenase